jgi:hypothetical protein
MRHLVPAAALLAALAAGCAGPATPGRRPTTGDPGIFQGTVAAGPQGAYESGRLSRESPAIAGPFVLTALGPGDELEIRPADGKGAAIGTLSGPLTTPWQVPAGVALALRPDAAGALYSGFRPMAMTRALEAYVGRSVQVAQGGAAPEPWLLRQIGADHLILERNRTYRVVPLRRVAEISWTDLAGVDPTPRLHIASE